MIRAYMRTMTDLSLELTLRLQALLVLTRSGRG